ncbi:hypothetical protein [Sphingomonas glacialis]|uniref:hypothetical protein n=1 Tax=Sphingomonas glacialis TaxID=658225 RepID=UPI001127E2A3|nr:hypothetical protein [Sphingomonas glacialis]
MATLRRKTPLRSIQTVRARGKYEPLEIQISRQTDVIEEHERSIAWHTAVQSWTNIISLVFGVITTALLVYLTYQQININLEQSDSAKKQVALEYAKVSPQFGVKMAFFPPAKDVSPKEYFPKSISIRLLRGDATINNVLVSQDIGVGYVPVAGKMRNQSNCKVRIQNYFEQGSSADINSNLMASKIASDPVFF